jgi:hypothetical protein
MHLILWSVFLAIMTAHSINSYLVSLPTVFTTQRKATADLHHVEENAKTSV